MLAATLGASLLGNMLTGRGMKSKIPECKAALPGLEVVPASEGTIRAGEGITNAG